MYNGSSRMLSIAQGMEIGCLWRAVGYRAPSRMNKQEKVEAIRARDDMRNRTDYTQR
jgi:hypothetical protein